MRLSYTHLFLPLLYGAVTAENPRIFHLDENWSDHVRDAARTAVDPSAARLIIAQRLGLARFHSLNDVDESIIQDVGRIGSLVQAPLGRDSGSSKTQVLIVVEGVDQTENVFKPSESSFEFELSSSPAPDTNARLLEDLASQAQYLEHTNTATFRKNLNYGKGLRTAMGKISTLTDVNSALHAGILLVHIKTLATIAKGSGSKSPEYQAAIISIRECLDTLSLTTIGEDISVTVAFFPLQQGIGNLFRRKAFNYGSYSIPELSSYFARQLDGEPSDSASGLPGTVPTAMLSGFPQLDSLVLETSSSSFASPSTSDLASSTSSKSISPPTGIIPACFSSKDNCESATNFCSGRGNCQAKYTYKERDNEISCFACSCEAEIRLNADGGKKTTLWSGPACQKKDVSMEFWLLAGFTIFFVGIISWGMGMLYTMGQQDLPSVIGAGVSGPRAK